MSLTLLLAIAWVLASTVVAFLPMRMQYIPGIALMLSLPVLLILLGRDYGWLAVALGLAAFVSMFRNPLRYFWAKARGLNPELPKEFRR